jgi:antibiotic biosynthesis monooxygenase (ABM) superfamily enzyme
MFSLNENSWPTMTLIMSLVAVLLITFVMVGWRKDLRRPTHSTRPTRP